MAFRSRAEQSRKGRQAESRGVGQVLKQAHGFLLPRDSLQISGESRFIPFLHQRVFKCVGAVLSFSLSRRNYSIRRAAGRPQRGRPQQRQRNWPYV